MQTQLIELREKQARIATNARAKLEEITDDTDEARSAEIEREFDAMMADFDKMEAQCERLRKLIEADEIANAPDPRRPVGEDRSARGVEDAPVLTYEDVFKRMLCYGVQDFTPEQRAVLQSGRDSNAELPAEHRAQSVGTTTAGGFLVPEGFSGEIDKQMAIWGPMWDASIVRELTTATGNVLPWPTVNDTANTGRIKAENASVDDDGTDDVVFAEKTLNAYIYDTGMIRVPLELLTDSFFDMESLISDLFGERLGRLANSQLTVGDGTGDPNGIVTASSLGKTAASATVFTADELIDLLHSVDPAYRASPKCRWQFNDTTLGVIRKLKDGQGNYLWQMGDVRSGEPNMLLAHPYSINQAMVNQATTTKPIIFGDHSRYIVRKVNGFTTITLRERYAEAFQIGMVGFKRFDGELLNTAAVKHLVMA